MLPRIKFQKSIYLDYAAATPLDLQVQKVMAPFLAGKFGNPSSLHRKGREAKEALERARKTVSSLIGARAEEIIFTAGGTESVNLAILGAVKSCKNRGTARPHIIVSAIEHHAVLNSAEALKREGYGITLVGVDSRGLVNLSELKRAVRQETALISIMYANNEIGTIQPIADMGKMLQRINTDRLRNGLTRIVFHTDACQAAGSLDLNVNKLGVDLMSVNGSKIYGPKQVGFLYVKSDTKIEPLVYGGGQERGIRSGTENVAGIAGLAEALRFVQRNRMPENKRMGKLQNYFIGKLLKIPGVELNGAGPAALQNNLLSRLPNNINISIRGVEGEALLLYLDSYGICASTGSACTTSQPDPSHVLLAIGKSALQARGSIRFTLGRLTKKTDLDYVLKILPGLIESCRNMDNI